MEIFRGDIIVANFEPIIGSEQGGVRPALVIQNNLGNKYGRTTIVAPLTTTTYHQKHPTRVPISKKESKLKKDSTVLLHQIRVIDKRRIGKRISRIPIHIQYKVDSAIKESLGLA